MGGWGVVAAWVGVIFALSSIPSSNTPQVDLPGLDKFVHMGVYSILGALFTRARPASGSSAWRVALLGALVGMIVGALDEWYQMSTPGRESDWRDGVADTLGAFLGSFTWKKMFS